MVNESATTGMLCKGDSLQVAGLSTITKSIFQSSFSRSFLFVENELDFRGKGMEAEKDTSRRY